MCNTIVNHLEVLKVDLRKKVFTFLNNIQFFSFTNVNTKMYTFVKQNYTYGFRTIV